MQDLLALYGLYPTSLRVCKSHRGAPLCASTHQRILLFVVQALLEQLDESSDTSKHDSNKGKESKRDVHAIVIPCVYHTSRKGVRLVVLQGSLNYEQLQMMGQCNLCLISSANSF